MLSNCLLDLGTDFLVGNTVFVKMRILVLEQQTHANCRPLGALPVTALPHSVLNNNNENNDHDENLKQS